MSHKFLGPIWPCVGPDFSEHLSKFREEFLRRECWCDARVVDYLARLEAQEELPEKVEELEKRLRYLTRAPKSKIAGRRGGVPL